MKTTQLIRSLPRTEFVKALTEAGAPAYQVPVVESFLFRKGAAAFDELTTLAKPVRAALEEKWSAEGPRIAGRLVDEDGTVKGLFEWGGEEKQGVRAEAVLMPSKAGRTLCISTQSGCRLRCAFCATGTMGLRKSLSFGEILDQVLYFSGEGEIGRIVVMGMGEPMENLDELLPALAFLTRKDGWALSRKRITVSTVGIVPELRRFSDAKPGVDLAVSLHAPDNRIRDAIVPVNRKYPLEEVLKAAREYGEENRAKVTIEYVLLDELNDSDEDAQALSRLSRRYEMPVNIIVYNPVANLPFSASRRLEEFVASLSKKAKGVTVRRSRGGRIAAACGQLAVSGS